MPTTRPADRSLPGALLGDRDRWPLWLPVFLAAGVGTYFALPSEPSWWVGPGSLVLALAVAGVARRWPIAFPPAVVGLVVCLGFAVAQVRAAMVAPATLEARHGPASVEGRVGRVEAFPNGTRVTLEHLRVDRLPAMRTPHRARIRLRGEQPRLAPGDWVRVAAVLMPPPPPSLPGGFDFQRKAYFEGLGAVGYAVGKARLTARAPPGIDSARLAVADFRFRLSERIRAALGDTVAGGVAAALMVGDRSAIPEDALAAMRDAGLAHLLAISGLHVGLVAGLVFFALRAVLVALPGMAVRWPIKKWAALGTLAAAFAYTQATGATVPTQRAFLMVGLVLLGVVLDRKGLSMRGLALAATVILLARPESLLGPSFQMSFAATTALVATYERLHRPLTALARRTGDGAWWRGPFLYLAGVVLTTLVAGLATAPYAAHHFHRLAAYGVVANLVAVPITALWIMPWLLMSYAAAAVGLEAWTLAPVGLGIDAVVWVARTTADLDGAVWRIPGLPVWGLVALTLGGLWVCLWRDRWRIVGLAGVVLGLLSAAQVQPPDVLIDHRGALMAARLPDGTLTLSRPRRGGFQQDTWMRWVGVESALAWSRFDAAPGRALSCDALGCVLRREGRTIALARDVAALADDCRSADLVISAVPVRGVCPSAVRVIDRFDLWRDGAHALWLGADGGIRVESANARRGNRPWVRKPRRSSTSR